jgi:hypothetical protein
MYKDFIRFLFIFFKLLFEWIFKAKVSARYGIFKAHQYVVTDVFTINKIQYVKVHNPHNQPDKLKKYLIKIIKSTKNFNSLENIASF